MQSLDERAEELKNQGNEFVKQGNYQDAIIKYTEAIDLKPTAIYYANRAYSHNKLKNYNQALSDACESINLDNIYAKAYFRLADAYVGLEDYEQAKIQYQKVIEFNPEDSYSQEKLKEINKLLKLKSDLRLDDINVDQTKNSEDKNITKSDQEFILDNKQSITPDICEKIMEQFKQQKILSAKNTKFILNQAKEQLKQLDSLVNIEIPECQEITICGDTHGQFYDLLNIFKLNGNPSKTNPYLFNGDFVDRGSFSVEVILTLLIWKISDNDCMHLTRGNHETRTMNKLYGFEGEVKHKYQSQEIFDLFSEVFCCLPLTYILNQKVMICHGGLFKQDNVKLDDIRKINRFREPPDDGLMCDLLWSDPIKFNGRYPSKRGISICFGPDVAHEFLDDNNLEILIRSHEVKDQGYEVEADGRVITIFSAPNYCDQMRNLGAYIKLKGSSITQPKYFQFSWVSHPNIPPMAYNHLSNITSKSIPITQKIIGIIQLCIFVAIIYFIFSKFIQNITKWVS